MAIRDRIVDFRRVLARDLLANPKNWRTHPKAQRDALKGVLDEIGYADALLARETPEGLQLIDGHLRADTTPNMEVPVLIVDLDEAEADKLLAVLDPLAAMAQPNQDALLGLLQEVEFGSAAVKDMLEALANGETQPMPDNLGQTDPDDVPDAPEAPWVQIGDLFQLGAHRVMCGSSTNPENVAVLFAERRAEITFTSPPYNLGANALLSTHQPNGSKYVQGDDSLPDDEYQSLLSTTVLSALSRSDYCFLNVQSLAGNKSVLINLLYELRDTYADTIVWDKQHAQPAMARRVLNSQFEFVHVFSHHPSRAIGSKDFRGTISNVVAVAKRASGEPTLNATFSVAFASFFVGQFCNQSVYEPFLGSGTTLIACEKLNRICYGMDIEPRYVQVTIERWEEYTGQKAVKL